METKKKLVTFFNQLLEKAEIKDLSRHKHLCEIVDFKSKCRKRIESYRHFTPEEISYSCSFYGQAGLKMSSGNKDEYIYIFPVKIQFSTNFSDYEAKNGRFTFKLKRKKYNELHEIYAESGLIPFERWESGYDYSVWHGIYAEKTFYAISYGQILRELSRYEYNELSENYAKKLCNLDLNFIESQIK